MSEQHRTGDPQTNDDIQVTRYGDGAAVRLWGLHSILGRDDAFDLLDKLRTVLARVAVDSVSAESVPDCLNCRGWKDSPHSGRRGCVEQGSFANHLYGHMSGTSAAEPFPSNAAQAHWYEAGKRAAQRSETAQVEPPICEACGEVHNPERVYSDVEICRSCYAASEHALTLAREEVGRWLLRLDAAVRTGDWREVDAVRFVMADVASASETGGADNG